MTVKQKRVLRNDVFPHKFLRIRPINLANHGAQGNWA